MLLDVDLKNTNQLAAEGVGTLVGIMLTDSNSGPAMKVAAGALGFVAGNASYNFLFGPGSVADSVEHPGAAIVKTLEGKGSLAQTATTAGADPICLHTAGRVACRLYPSFLIVGVYFFVSSLCLRHSDAIQLTRSRTDLLWHSGVM